GGGGRPAPAPLSTLDERGRGAGSHRHQLLPLPPRQARRSPHPGQPYLVPARAPARLRPGPSLPHRGDSLDTALRPSTLGGGATRSPELPASSQRQSPTRPGLDRDPSAASSASSSPNAIARSPR